MIRNSKLPGLIFISLLVACAQQTSPTGGPKDEAPPILIQSIPKSNQLNYQGKTITLTFDEDVIISNPKEQIIITPDIGPDYEILAKRNKVTVTLNESLKDTTTYSFNFGEAIQDLTEKNPAENMQIAFSTGPTIDSLSISGTVYDLLKGNPAEKIVVAIYQHADTFNIFKHKPSYITRTQKEGAFRISNLKSGNYYIYAYHDKNRNLIVDSKSEKYGFLVNPIILTEDTTNITIPILPMDATELKITRARAFSNYFSINLSKNITDYSIKEMESSNTVTSSYGENKSNIITYNTTANTDSLLAKFNATDTLGSNLDTTFYIKYAQREVTPEKFSATNEQAQVFSEKGLFEGKFKLNKPLHSINFDSLYLYIDSTTQIHFTDQDILLDSNNLTLTILKSFDKKILEKPITEVEEKDSISTPQVKRKRGESPTLEERANMTIAEKKPNQPKDLLYQGKGAFISIDRDSSSSSKPNLKYYKTQDLALFIIQIETQEDFIVNLLNKDYQIVQTKTNQKSTKFEDIIPGDYKIQVIIDINKNGKWDSGNISKKIQPEPILFYLNLQGTQSIPAKANWEVTDMLIQY